MFVDQDVVVNTGSPVFLIADGELVAKDRGKRGERGEEPWIEREREREEIT